MTFHHFLAYTYRLLNLLSCMAGFESINNTEGFVREEIDAKPFLKIGCTEKECFNSEILRIGAPDHGSLVNFV